MNLLILGASGGCGQWAVQVAKERGHGVRAMVRRETPWVPPHDVQVVRGAALDRNDVEAALHDIDAVICCIGIRRRNPRNPWSRVISPRDLTVQVARILVDLLPKHRVERMVAISAGGVGDSVTRLSRINRRLFEHSNIGVAYRDLEDMEQVLAASNLDWQAVRPTTLTNGPLTRNARVVERYGLLTRISRADVASWMIDAVEAPEPFADRTPMIATHG